MINKKVFSLDIGTRSVTGIILEKHMDMYTVIDFCTEEHKERSMLDGHIHDVVAVAEVIRDVKSTLEQRHGELYEVSVAAAGRALKTIQATASIQLEQQPITAQETIKFLELSAVQAAQSKLARKENKNDYKNYYCVGYSILHYSLDEEIIGSLIDQNGEQASVEVIATFLPKVVVESLLAALSRANLEMEALTLEPIAAINVLIPDSMRRLNIALVDIGAGTSDIAITNKGSVVAYGMVPTAGDKITETISDHYLLDFPTAEKTKRNIVNDGEDTVEDILGFETTVTYDDLIENITETVTMLASSLATEIIRLNQKAPMAVMLVGGGSLTPNITSLLASKLHLPANRVAIRGIDAIQNLNKNENLPTGPNFVTPIGIAIAAQQNPVHYISVKVNKRIIRMFEMKQLTVGDCLVQTGIEMNKYYGKPGLASIVTIDGQLITLPGEYGNPPTILVNNIVSTIDTEVHNGDEILINKGSDGSEPRVTIEEVIGEIIPVKIKYNEKTHEIKPIYQVNNQIMRTDYIIQDKDVIIMKHLKSIHDFLSTILLEDMNTMKPFNIYVNNKIVSLANGQSQMFVNDKEVTIEYHLKDGDRLNITPAITPTVENLLKKIDKSYWKKTEITFNNKRIFLKQEQLIISKDGLELAPGTILKQNDYIEINERKLHPFIFQDVFRYVDLDVSNVKGHFNLYKNNEPTTFYETILAGDKLEIKWD